MAGSRVDGGIADAGVGIDVRLRPWDGPQRQEMPVGCCSVEYGTMRLKETGPLVTDTSLILHVGSGPSDSNREITRLVVCQIFPLIRVVMSEDGSKFRHGRPAIAGEVCVTERGLDRRLQCW